MSGAGLDADLDALEHDARLAIARAMRASIRAHRDAAGHDLCWHQPDLWAHLPEAASFPDHVSERSVFMKGCIRYLASLGAQLLDVSRRYEGFMA